MEKVSLKLLLFRSLNVVMVQTSQLCNVIASIAQTSLSFPCNFLARNLHNTVING